MSRLSRALALLVLFIVVGGAIFLMTWDIPPPTARIERVIPNDTFPQ